MFLDLWCSLCVFSVSSHSILTININKNCRVQKPSQGRWRAFPNLLLDFGPILSFTVKSKTQIMFAFSATTEGSISRCPPVFMGGYQWIHHLFVIDWCCLDRLRRAINALPFPGCYEGAELLRDLELQPQESGCCPQTAACRMGLPHIWFPPLRGVGCAGLGKAVSGKGWLGDVNLVAELLQLLAPCEWRVKQNEKRSLDGCPSVSAGVLDGPCLIHDCNKASPFSYGKVPLKLILYLGLAPFKGLEKGKGLLKHPVPISSSDGT